MNVTAQGMAVFCGAILATVAAWGLTVDVHGPWAQDFMLASWLPPIVLFPGAALAAALSGQPTDRFEAHARVLWPTYTGLALYGVVVGHWWFERSSGFPMLITAAHTAAFILVGGVLVPFPKTRPAAFQIWFGYAVLLVTWFAGAFGSAFFS